MASSMSRRGFLRGREQASDVAPSPPWAAADFARLCRGCPDCVAACPESVLSIGSDGRAQIQFDQGGCSLCGGCVTACGTGALVPHSGRPWPHVAEAGANCLSLAGVMCSSCADMCGVRALRLKPMLGGRAIPLIDQDACTGCGACVPVCPVQAVRMIPQREESQCA